jgi:hypothetical protein
MALRAMTTAGTENFVSVADPSVTEKTKIFNDPADESKGFREVAAKWDEDASVFKVRPLDVFLMGYIYDNASTLTGKSGSEEVGIHTKVNQTNIDCVKFGLAALPDDFQTESGERIRMDTTKKTVGGREYNIAADKVIGSLGLRLISEMAQKIKDISEVTAAEEKKSGKASSQSA